MAAQQYGGTADDVKRDIDGGLTEEEVVEDVLGPYLPDDVLPEDDSLEAVAVAVYEHNDTINAKYDGPTELVDEVADRLTDNQEPYEPPSAGEKESIDHTHTADEHDGVHTFAWRDEDGQRHEAQYMQKAAVNEGGFDQAVYQGDPADELPGNNR